VPGGVRDSGLDWTIVRQPRGITNEPPPVTTARGSTDGTAQRPHGCLSRGGPRAYCSRSSGDPATIHHHIGSAR